MRRRRVAAWSAGSLALLAAVAAVPLAMLYSATGTAWLLRQLPRLEVQGPEGALLGDRLAATRIVWDGPAGRLELQDLRVEGMQRRWLPAPGQWLALSAGRISVGAVRWTSAPRATPAPPPVLPSSLRLPVALDAPVQVGELALDALAPVRDLQAAVHLGADAGTYHRVDGLALRWDRLSASGRLTIATSAPFELDAAADAGSLPEATQPWQARLSATGPLERVALAGTLRGRDDAQSADVAATVVPFAPWPLAALTARTRALDLARLADGWPQTALDGQAELRSSARDAPFDGTLNLVNTLPGRWNEGRLPLKRAEARLRALLAEPDRVQIESLVLELADASGPAGRWSARGDWRGPRLQLDSTLQGLVPQSLDGRAAGMLLGGSVTVDVQGLPSPDPQAAAAAEPWSVAAQGRLAGRLDAAPVPVQLVFDGRARADEVALRTLQARAGQAEASATATLRRAGTRWALAGNGKLVEFDPVPWWPGAEGSAWRRGPHRLNGDWTLALTLPEAGRADALWRRIDGQAQLTLADSRLAGVPLHGQARLAPGRNLEADLDVGGNTLALRGRADAAGDGQADRWQLDLKAPALAALAPLAALHPDLAVLPHAGRAEATASLQGRWPQVQGQGRAEGSALRAGRWALGQGTLDFRFGETAEQQVAATLALAQLEVAGQKIPVVNAELEGTLASHHLRADAALPAAPPPDVVQMLSLRTRDATQVQLRADGALRQDGDRWRWAGRLQRLTAGGWDGKLPLAAPAPRDWLDAGPVAAEAELDAAGTLQRLRVDGGRLVFAESMALVWNEIRLDGGTWQARATLEGFRAAPLLARWQPTMGWAGDLRLGASLDIRAGERFDADLVFERQEGDLRVRDAVGAELVLGLSDLRLALHAHDGTWYFTQALAGRALGELGGALRVVTSPQSRWPAREAPLDGTIQARVANLGVWGAWVPPGWRLEGMLETKAQFGGRFGAPQLRGELVGSGLGVRNLLQGVQVSGGDVLVRLEGEKATVERFRLAGGDGSLTVSGDADLGAAPRARLALEADRFRVLGRVDRRLVASGRAELDLQPQAVVLKGRVAVDEALFDTSRAGAPSLDEDVTVRRSDQPEPETAEGGAPRARRTIDVALDVDLGPRLRVRGRGLDTLLTGQLRVTAPGGRVAVTGTVNTERGTYAAYGQKLEIERGLLAFSGPPDNPRLDVLALRPNLDIEVGVAITGTAQAPRVRLHSNPELSDTDKLSWLVLGRDPTGLGRADTALLQRAAVALLAGEGEAPTDTLIRNLGLDEVSVRQSDGEVRETIVTLGKQLSRRWYVGYERGVNATVGTWQLIYRIAQRFTLRAQSGSENSLDLIWTWRVP